MTKQRMTKKMVSEELDTLRKKIKGYSDMTLVELQREFEGAFPAEVAEREAANPTWLLNCSREFLTYRLTMAATYFMALVLDLD